MRMEQGVRTGLGHGGITCVLQTQFSSLNKRLGYIITINREQRIGNRELVPCSLFIYILTMFQIGNKELVPGSFLTIFEFILVLGFVYFISM